MSNRVLVQFTVVDLENKFAEKGINAHPKTIEILADVIEHAPIADLLFDSVVAAVKVVGRQEFQRRYGKEYVSCLEELCNQVDLVEP